jgi:hypothetical protein
MGFVRKLALVVVFAVACGAAAHAQTLALAYKKGEVQKYTLHSIVNESINTGRLDIPIKVDMSAKEALTVVSVDSAGVADLSVALTDVVIKTDMNGSSGSTTANVPVQQIKIAADGKILSLNGQSSSANPFVGLSTGGNMVSAIFPSTAVKPGDTWSKDYDQTSPQGGPAIHVTTKSKYLRDETLKGVNTAVVETTSSSDFDFTMDLSTLAGAGASSPFPVSVSGLQGISIKGTTTTDATTWIDPSGHRIVKTRMTSKTNANMSFTLAPGSSLSGLLGPMSVTGDQTLDLLPA